MSVSVHEIVAAAVKGSFGAHELAIVEEIDKQPEGLGDTLKNLFEKIGADKAAALYSKLTGSSCGCEERRAWLNKWWPYKTT